METFENIADKIKAIHSSITNLLLIVQKSNLNNHVREDLNFALLSEVKNVNKVKTSSKLNDKKDQLQEIQQIEEKLINLGLEVLNTVSKQNEKLRNIIIDFSEPAKQKDNSSLFSSQQVLDNNFLCQLELFKKISVEEMV